MGHRGGPQGRGKLGALGTGSFCSLGGGRATSSKGDFGLSLGGCHSFSELEKLPYETRMVVRIRFIY